jgi:hypothetical protein
MSVPSVFVQESPLHVCAPIGSIGIEMYMQYLIQFVPNFALELFTRNLTNQNRWVGCREKRNPSQNWSNCTRGLTLPFGVRRTRRGWGWLAAALHDERRAVTAAWKTKDGRSCLTLAFFPRKCLIWLTVSVQNLESQAVSPKIPENNSVL